MTHAPHCDDVDVPETCYGCEKPFVQGDLVYSVHDDFGLLHADCAGTNPEDFVDGDGEHLKPGDPLPKPWPWQPLVPHA